MTTETWRPIPGYTGYEASDQGRVRSSRIRHGRPPGTWLLTTGVNDHGYLRVRLRDDAGARRMRLVHQLVLEAFVGPRPAGFVTRHLDGDRQRNDLANLRYGTPLENARDMREHGTHHYYRRSHCKHGHEFTPENTRQRTDGRRCLTCEAEVERRRPPRKHARRAVADEVA